MKAFVLIFTFVLSTAQAHQEHKAHREHKAHLHGAAKLSVAFDQASGKAEFETPAEAIVGFEHKAKTEKQKKQVQEAFDKFEKQFPLLLKMDPALNCQFQKEKMEMVQGDSENHSDFHAAFQISCSRSPLGTTVQVDLTSYKKLKNTEITVLVGDLQKTVRAQKQAVQIELKP